MFRKRNLLVALATFVIGVGAFAAIWGVPRVLRRSTSISSQVTAYLLDDRGEVNGLLLASGDQLHFSPQTGAVVASLIKAGDEVTVSGHAGSQSNYGREFRVEQISANGKTIVAVQDGPPRPHSPHDRRGTRDRGEDRGGRPGPREQSAQDGAPPSLVGSEPNPSAPNVTPVVDPNAKPTEKLASEPLPVSLPEIFKATGTIRTHLVNGRGHVDGLILSSGEQIRFSPRVGELVVAAEHDAATQVSVEGNGVRNERGTVIRPTQITVGNQTISLGR
jgi:hypothetical protein